MRGQIHSSAHSRIQPQEKSNGRWNSAALLALLSLQRLSAARSIHYDIHSLPLVRSVKARVKTLKVKKKFQKTRITITTNTNNATHRGSNTIQCRALFGRLNWEELEEAVRRGKLFFLLLSYLASSTVISSPPPPFLSVFCFLTLTQAWKQAPTYDL